MMNVDVGIPTKRGSVVGVFALALILAAAPAQARTSPDTRCLLASGKAATKCVRDYGAAVGACRDKADAACETALRAAGGTLDGLLAATEAPTRRSCSAASADKLTFSLGLDDLVFRTAQACKKWAEDFLGLAYADDLLALSPAARACQGRVATQLRGLRDTVVRAFGRTCYVSEFAGRACDRQRRDDLVTKARTAAAKHIMKQCAARFDQLGLSSGATLEARVNALADVIVGRARHLAQRVYPPLNLGPTGLLGPHPVGVTTLDLVDSSRPNPVGTGFRPLTTEVYYPSTPEAVVGVPRDILQLFGVNLGATPTYRDVARAPGTFPLIVYSHGGGLIRFDNSIKMAHLASHGFIVVSPEHPGSDIVSPLGDPFDFENRPLDLRFLIDQFLGFNAEAGNSFEGAIDPARIGGVGFSFGGYGVTTLATGPFFRGTFTDPRVKAILPLDGAMGSEHWGADAPAVFATITIPTLLLGGELTQSAELAPFLQAMFGVLPPGPSVIGYGVLHEAGHGTFSDTCEAPDALLQAINGGPVPECEPESLPWRYARHIIDYLSLNFFDGVLNGNAEALARLAPAVLADIEELTYQSK